jgi:hypothetical protein
MQGRLDAAVGCKAAITPTQRWQRVLGSLAQSLAQQTLQAAVFSVILYNSTHLLGDMNTWT